jgi:hypothetical protein
VPLNVAPLSGVVPPVPPVPPVGGGAGVELPGSVDQPGSCVHQGVAPVHQGSPGREVDGSVVAPAGSPGKDVDAVAVAGKATIAARSAPSAILGNRARRVVGCLLG